MWGSFLEDAGLKPHCCKRASASRQRAASGHGRIVCPTCSSSKLLVIKPKVGLSLAEMPTSGCSVFHPPLQLGRTEPQAPALLTFKQDAADGRILHSSPAVAWPQPVSKARSCSKSIQHLPSIQACLSAVQTARAGTSGCPSTLCLWPPGDILWPSQSLSSLVSFNKFHFCSCPPASFSVIRK